MGDIISFLFQLLVGILLYRDAYPHLPFQLPSGQVHTEKTG